MNGLFAERDAYLNAFARFEAGRAPADQPPLRALRQAAIARFERLGFPTARNEAWRYTSVAPIARTLFAPADGDGDAAVDAAALALALPPAINAHRLVFVDGRFAPGLSAVGALPGGARMESLAAALAAGAPGVEDPLGRVASFEDAPFVSLNAAFFADGAWIPVPDGVALDRPLLVVRLTSGRRPAAATHPRILVVAGRDSRATVVEIDAGFGPEPYLTNAVTEIVAGPGAAVEHVKVGLESPAAYHVATVAAALGRASSFNSHHVTLGGALVRIELSVAFGDPGGECTLNGLYVASGRQHLDHHTRVEHAVPRCRSRELYKGVVDGRSTAVFNGQIHVHPGALKTDATQTNQNLLLSADATVNTKPQLQIDADDVKCTHGAAVGQLDEDQVFYLRARGVGPREARAMLTHAFAAEVLRRVPIEPLRADLERRLGEKLARSGEEAA